MTRVHFLSLCGEMLINPAIALDDYDLRALLAGKRSDKAIRAYMIANF